jgi:hypothetical protein
LAEASLIDTETISLLERLRDGRAKFVPDGLGARFALFTTARITGSDELNGLVCMTHTSRIMRRSRPSTTPTRGIGPYVSIFLFPHHGSIESSDQTRL